MSKGFGDDQSEVLRWRQEQERAGSLIDSSEEGMRDRCVPNNAILDAQRLSHPLKGCAARPCSDNLEIDFHPMHILEFAHHPQDCLDSLVPEEPPYVEQSHR